MEISYLAAFIGGLLMLFAPCAAMLLPAFFAYAFTSRTTLLARTAVFALGVLLVLVPLGAFAGTLGAFIRSHAHIVTLVAGILVIVLGLLQMFAVSFPVPQWASKLMTPQGGSDEAGAPSNLATFALGVGYAIAGVGCSGPILGAVLSFATLGGSVWAGGLMATFAHRHGASVGILALLWNAFNLSKIVAAPPPRQTVWPLDNAHERDFRRPVRLAGRHPSFLRRTVGTSERIYVLPASRSRIKDH